MYAHCHKQCRPFVSLLLGAAVVSFLRIYFRYTHIQMYIRKFSCRQLSSFCGGWGCTIYILNSAKFIISFEVCPMEALDMPAISPVICPSTKCVLDDFPVNGIPSIHARFVVQAHKQMQLHIK